MKINLSFRCIAYDTGNIPPSIPKGYSAEFFKDRYEKAQSVAEEHEKTIVRWFFNNTLLRTKLFEELNIKQGLPFKLQVDNRGKKPGDIDVLIYDPNSPHKAIAVECKRVKAIVEENGYEKVNKIEDIKNGIKQANDLRRGMGFHNSYLAIFIEVDGRERKEEFNFFFRGLSDQNLKRVYDFPLRDKLHDDVGIIFIEIVQPIDRLVDKAGMVCICIDKKAKPISQPASLTNRIIELFERPRAIVRDIRK